MVRVVVAGFLTAVLLAGCASGLRYTPAEQPAGVRVAADYRIVGDRVRVSIESGGHRLEDVLVLRADGAVVRPIVIEPPARSGGSGLGIGIGVGGSIGSGGGVSIGSGVGVGTGVGGGGRRYFVADFPLEQVGPPPWSLHVKAVGIQPMVIVLPPSSG
jgi:hypothetical protein